MAPFPGPPKRTTFSPDYVPLELPEDYTVEDLKLPFIIDDGISDKVLKEAIKLLGAKSPSKASRDELCTRLQYLWENKDYDYVNIVENCRTET